MPRSHAADRAGGWSQALQHGYGWADRTLGVMPLYHTMGIHSLVAMHLVGGCFVPQARWDAGEALRLIEEQRISSLYLAPTLFHDLVHHPSLWASADVGSVRALGYAGAAMTSTLVRRCADVFSPEVFVNHYGSTEVYTFSIGRDQLAKPGCAGRPAVNTRMQPPRDGGDLSSTSPPPRRSPATGTGQTPTRRRSTTAGTRPATRATWTRTATSGSTAGSTT